MKATLIIPLAGLLVTLGSLAFADEPDYTDAKELCRAAEAVTGENLMCWATKKPVAYWACQLREAVDHGTTRASGNPCWTKN